MKKKLFQALGFILAFVITYTILLILFNNFNYHYCIADAYLDALISMIQVLFLVVLFFFSELLLKRGISYSIGLGVIVIVFIFLILLDLFLGSEYKDFYTNYLFTVKGFFITEAPIIIAFLIANVIKICYINKMIYKSNKQ